MALTLNKDKGLIVQKIGSDLVIFDSERSELLTLNETAASIYKLIKKGLDEETISQKIAKDYAISEEKALEDIRGLVEKMKKRKILL
ncbi:MAG: PqqD family protein [Candidatus Roizmanbacteria bacterium]|nr:PqqD family protein [Candidatus Roizmanbacteria bacterium]